MSYVKQFSLIINYRKIIYTLYKNCLQNYIFYKLLSNNKRNHSNNETKLTTNCGN